MEQSAWTRLSVLTTLLWMVVFGSLSSCRHPASLEQADEQSAFQRYVDSLDSQAMENQYHSLLQRESSSWKADLAVKERYQQATDKPLWYDRMGVSTDADTLLAVLRRELPMAGLDSMAFYVDQIAHDLRIVRLLTFDSLGVDINEVLPRLDYSLSKAFVRYCVGQRYGFMRPDRLLNRMDLRPHSKKPDDYLRLFDYEVMAPDYSEALQAIMSDDRMAYLKASLPKSPFYQALRTLMATTEEQTERHKIAVNMERCRWQMAFPPLNEKVVLVNIPAQQLWAVSADSVLTMRICCGAVTNKTPLLHSEISYMQVNPDWIVPQNIVKSDFLRHAGDSAYFARNHYYIMDRSTGDTLRPADVTAEELEEGYLRVGQTSGAGNSLGRIVFRFPNDFGVYLHDTNNRSAFKRERRTLSHGCIRIEKPFEMACFLLPNADEWTLEQLRLSMDIPPQTARGKKYLKEHVDTPRPLRLISYREVSPKVPLFFLYFTAFPNPETGCVEFWPDLYGYDRVIEEAVPFLR